MSLAAVMTELSLNPFESTRLTGETVARLGDTEWSVADLKVAVGLAPADGTEGAWASCDTCSDPGPDKNTDPFA